MKTFSKLLLAIGLVAAIGIFLPVYSNVNQLTPTTLASQKIGQLGVQLMVFADDHGGNFPRQLSELFEDAPKEIHVFRDPKSKKSQDWLYFPGHKLSDPPSVIIAACPVTTDNQNKGFGQCIRKGLFGPWLVQPFPFLNQSSSNDLKIKETNDAQRCTQFAQRPSPSGLRLLSSLCSCVIGGVDEMKFTILQRFTAWDS